MIDRIAKEVQECLGNGHFVAALTMALTLPDICGKAQYPQLEGRTKQRYMKWFEEHIGQYERSLLSTENEIGLTSELVYSLRCSLLHQGNPNIDGERLGVNYFELVCNPSKVSMCDRYLQEQHWDDQGNIVETKVISVNVSMLCGKLCEVATNYYKSNKEKFDFFNYNLVDCDLETRRLFGLK